MAELLDLKRAVDYLAARCDFAHEDDGVGFNSSDTVYGHELAQVAFDAWSEDDRIAVRAMLQKYGGQLNAVDIVPADLPREAPLVTMTAEERIARERAAIETSRGVRTKNRAKVKADAKRLELVKARHVIALRGSEFVVEFPYHKQMVADLKAIPGRKRFNAGPPAGWLLRVDDVEPQRLIDFLEKYAYTTPDDVRAKLVELIKHPRPKLSTTSATQAAVKTIAVAEDGISFDVYFPYEAATVEAFKRQVPAGRFLKEPAPHWNIPMRAASVEGLGRFIASDAGARFDVGDRVREVIAGVLETQRGAIEASRAAQADDGFVARFLEKVPEKLRDNFALRENGERCFGFQIAGVRYALEAKRVIIGDEMGLGKTIQAIMTLAMGDAFPAVIVCPASLVFNWYRELRKWLPNRTISVLTSGRQGAYYADILIINYDILTERAPKGEKRAKPVRGQKREVPLSRHARGILERNPRAIVFDEMHYLKNHKALRTQAAGVLAKLCEYRIGLSGTMILNRPSELIAPLSILGRLGDLGGFHFFTRHFCGAADTNYGVDITGASNLDELNTKLRASCYIRREKSQVLEDMPEKTWTTVAITIDNRDEYDRVAKDVAGWFSERAGRSAKFLAALDVEMADLRKRLILDGLEGDALNGRLLLEREARIEQHEKDAYDRAERSEQLLRIEALKQLAVKGKMAAALEWVEAFTEEQKLIAFAHHVDVQAAILERFKPIALRHHSDDAKDDRDRQVQRFQDEPAKRLLVGSLSMAVGYTATAASNVAFFELAWRPGDMDQAIDRAHRIGQRSAVTGYKLIAQDTIEEDIDELLDSKRVVVEAALIGGVKIERVSILTELAARLMQPKTSAPAHSEAFAF